MIISASRRTDIPAFFSRWFINRIQAGFCTVVNPFNPHQQRTVSLHPQDVDALIFWTRFSAPLMPWLKDLEQRGFSYYFLYTITGYGPPLEPHLPDTCRQIEDFRRLARMIGPERVIWRYDPIILTTEFSPAYHQNNFKKLADQLSASTEKVIISFLDMYRKTRAALAQLGNMNLIAENEKTLRTETVTALADIALHHRLEIQSCAEADMPFIKAGKCIDDQLITRLTGRQPSGGKDPNQRPACHCIKSVDIGRYHTCAHGCVYCYATCQTNKVRAIHSHDPSHSWL